jgi:hypothetical protein
MCLDGIQAYDPLISVALAGVGRGLGRWFDGYNQERPHQALGYATPAEVYFDPGAHGAQPASWEAMQPQNAKPQRKT